MPLTTSAVLHVIAYMALCGIGFIFLFASLKASIYTGREWKRGDMFWVWQHGRATAAYALIGVALAIAAFRMLAH